MITNLWSELKNKLKMEHLFNANSLYSKGGAGRMKLSCVTEIKLLKIQKLYSSFMEVFGSSSFVLWRGVY